MSDIKQAYASSAALTFTSIASLASSTTLVAGGESTAVDNTSNLYFDYLLAGKIAVNTGSALTASTEIRIYVVGILDDSTWPDVFDGTDSAETWTNVNMRDAAGKSAAVIAPATTANVVYAFGPVSVRALFGGNMPKKFVVWLTHNTGQTLAASGSTVWVTGTYETVT